MSLSETNKSVRILQAMTALQLIIRGIPKEAACEQTGLSEWQFDQWIASENEAIEQLQHDIAEAERIRLAQLANAQAILLTSLIDSVTVKGYADHETQLKVLKYIDNLRKELETKHGVHTQTDEAQEYIMAGPQTRVEDSKMHVPLEMSRSTVNIKTMPDGSVDLTIPVPTNIIDIFPALDDGLAATSEEESDPVS